MEILITYRRLAVKNESHKELVLVLGNPLNHEGGMVEFNRGLINKINESDFVYVLEPMTLGSRMYLFYKPVIKKMLYPAFFLYDLVNLLLRSKSDDVSIIQVNPSLILVPMIRDGIVIILNSLFIKKKIIVVFHGWRVGYLSKCKLNKISNIFHRYVIGRADHFFVLSEKFKHELIDFGVDSKKISVTTTFFKKQDISVEAKLSRSDYYHVPRFLFLGRVSRLKGVEDLLDAVSLASKTSDGFFVDIVGHGDKPGLLDEYRHLVDQKGIANFVSFHGRVEGSSKFELYKNSDVFILPSYTEGCPTAVIEALASGLFVISTDVGALEELINCNNGIKSKPGDVEALAAAITFCIININEVRSRKQMIAAECAMKYEVSVVASKFISIYEKLDE